MPEMTVTYRGRIKQRKDRTDAIVIIPKKIIEVLQVKKGDLVKITIENTAVGIYDIWKRIQKPSVYCITLNDIDFNVTALKRSGLIDLKISRCQPEREIHIFGYDKDGKMKEIS